MTLRELFCDFDHKKIQENAFVVSNDGDFRENV